MKVTAKPLLKAEQDEMLKLLEGSEFQNVIRVVASMRDERMVLASESELKADEFPQRAVDADVHMRAARRYENFLGVVTELIDFAQRNPTADFTVNTIEPTQLLECKRKYEPVKK